VRDGWMPSRATERSKKSYRRRRAKLIEAMGGKCDYCGSVEKLEFHHLQRRTWVARNLSRWSRIARYWEEFEWGVLKLACAPCNKRLGQPEASEDDGQF